MTDTKCVEHPLVFGSFKVAERPSGYNSIAESRGLILRVEIGTGNNPLPWLTLFIHVFEDSRKVLIGVTAIICEDAVWRADRRRVWNAVIQNFAIAIERFVAVDIGALEI